MDAENLDSQGNKAATSRFAFTGYLGLIIAILSLLVALAVGGMAFWNKQQLMMQLVSQNTQLQITHADLQTQQNTLNTLQQRWQALSQWRIQMNRWQLAQAGYFVQLANFNLQTQVNVPAAMQLLKMADDSLSPANTTLLSNIHQQLLQNIQALQAVSLPDSATLLTQLDALNQQISELPATLDQKSQATQPNPNTTTMPAENNIPSFWQRRLESWLNDLRQLVVVRHTTSAPTLLTTAQRQNIQQAIQLKLLQAEWAVLNHQSAVYQQSLKQVRQWLQQYYPQGVGTLPLVLQNLEQLQNIVITPPLPDITPTLQAIQTAYQQLGNSGLVNNNTLNNPQSLVPPLLPTTPAKPPTLEPPTKPNPPAGPESIAS